jgi:precorrin-2 dehydrogenase/sirohydrochlorin ferrochelatase
MLQPAMAIIKTSLNYNLCKKMQKYYPIFISLKDKKVLVVGGGRVSERKIQGLLNKEAVIYVVSPELTQGLKKLAAAGLITWYNRFFQPQDLQDAWLVIAATNDPATQRLISELAAANHIFCNVVNAPEQGSFINPTIIENGPIQVAVSTSGSSPVLAKRLKQELTPVVTRHSTGYIAFLEEMRTWIIATEDNAQKRKELLLSLDNTRIEESFTKGQWHYIEDWVKKNYGYDALYIVKKHTKS